MHSPTFKSQTDTLPWFGPEWSNLPGVRAMSTLRMGGVSRAPFDQFNLATHVGDDPAAVSQNRRRLRAHLKLPAEPVWLNQVHGNEVVLLQEPMPEPAVPTPPTADAALTTSPNVVCAILTADCLPVLFTSSDGAVVAAAHAGWRGLSRGVLVNTVLQMRQQMNPDAEILAWLGPAISLHMFEVGADVRAEFLKQHAATDECFTPNSNNRWQCDIYGLARVQLELAGVTQISGARNCTYAQSQWFFSHRRDVTHRGQASTGRMATLIWRESP